MSRILGAVVRVLKLTGGIGRSFFWTAKGIRQLKARRRPAEVKSKDGKVYIYLARENVLVGKFERQTGILDGLKGTKIPIKDAIFMDMDEGFYKLKAVKEAQKELLTKLRPRVINGKVVLEVKQ